MYEPNMNEENLMRALQDLGYQVWWTGYEIDSDAANFIKNTVDILIRKGWVKGE
jgi:glucan phosphoethanolaminetransferase (alkaline phosphatase superfamily)